MASYALPAQAKATPRPDPLLFLGGPACRWPGIRSQRASEGHFNGFLWAFQRRQKLPQGQIHCFFWAVQRAVGQAFAANRHPKATSMAFSMRPSLPFASPKTLQKPLKGHFNGFLWASSAGKSPHPWLFMGVQACRLPALKPSKPLKPLKGHFNG